MTNLLKDPIGAAKSAANAAAETYKKSSPAAKTAMIAGLAALAAKLNQSDQCSKEFYSTFWAVAGVGITAALVGPKIYNHCHNQYLTWQGAKTEPDSPLEMTDRAIPRKE